MALMAMLLSASRLTARWAYSCASLRPLVCSQQLSAGTPLGDLPAASCSGAGSSRGFAAEAAAESNETFTVTVNPYKTHNVDPPGRELQTSRSELMTFYEDMYKSRRMEIAADMLYKQKIIRGFLHLADGQEAVPFGMEAALSRQDSVIQSYRDHMNYVARGGPVFKVMAELMGRVHGASKGKGGSMHLYSKEGGFYGGEGIVGDQVPLGVGLGFKHKYRKDGNCSVALYGDGAANQGQLFEALNIAALWSLPTILICENNHYGMGTAEWRAAKSTEFYKRGDYVPGIWVDGMDVLCVKNAVAYAKEYVLKNGPIILEMDTYRYHGHSISDPGSSYRTRDEIAGIRRARDPIEHVKTLLEERNMLDAGEAKRLEKQWKAQVAEDIEAAKKDSEPPIDFLWKHIYADGLGAKLRPIEIGLPKIQL